MYRVEIKRWTSCWDVIELAVRETFWCHSFIQSHQTISSCLINLSLALHHKVPTFLIKPPPWGCDPVKLQLLVMCWYISLFKLSKILGIWPNSSKGSVWLVKYQSIVYLLSENPSKGYTSESVLLQPTIPAQWIVHDSQSRQEGNLKSNTWNALLFGFICTSGSVHFCCTFLHWIILLSPFQHKDVGFVHSSKILTTQQC